MTVASPVEYGTFFDSSNLAATSDAWTLTSPNGTVWSPSITTAGVVSLTDGAVAAGLTVSFAGLDGTKWTPTISNGGVVTVTSGGALSSSDTLALVTDSAGVSWTLYVDDANQVNVTTATALPGLLRYPSFIFSYTPASGADDFRLYSARLNVTIRRKSA